MIINGSYIRNSSHHIVQRDGSQITHDEVEGWMISKKELINHDYSCSVCVYSNLKKSSSFLPACGGIYVSVLLSVTNRPDLLYFALKIPKSVERKAIYSKLSTHEIAPGDS